MPYMLHARSPRDCWYGFWLGELGPRFLAALLDLKHLLILLNPCLILPCLRSSHPDQTIFSNHPCLFLLILLNHFDRHISFALLWKPYCALKCWTDCSVCPRIDIAPFLFASFWHSLSTLDLPPIPLWQQDALHEAQAQEARGSLQAQRTQSD